MDVRFAGDAFSNTDIATGSDRVAGLTAHGRVAVAVDIIQEPLMTVGGVAAADSITQERLTTDGGVVGAGIVVRQENDPQ